VKAESPSGAPLVAALALALVVGTGLADRGEDYRERRRDAVVEAVEAVGPAVVNISTQRVVDNRFQRGRSPWDFFFGLREPRERSYMQNSLGSGVIVDPEGYVLTNDHVIGAADRIIVTLQDERQVEAEVVGSDRASDLAVLRLREPGPWPAVEMGGSDDLMSGETVVAIGNPFGLQNTVTTGVISAVGRTLAAPVGETEYADFIQTDAAINPGNSGGALLNINGELIGINTQILAKAQNLGFAIPIDRARKVLGELIHYGRVRPAFTGLVVEELDATLARSMDLEEARGVLVVRRFADSPAAAADIQAGDLITELDGVRIATIAEYDTALARVPEGERVVVRLVRNGSELDRQLEVSVFPRERAEEFAWQLLGFTVTEARQGVVIERVRPDSWLADAASGDLRGLRVVQLNNRRIGSADDFFDAIPGTLYRRSANLRVADRRYVYRVTIPLR
jgi:serine protease Do